MENEFYFSSSNSPIKLRILLRFPQLHLVWFFTFYHFSPKSFSISLIIFIGFSQNKTLNTGSLVIAPDKTLPKSSQFLVIFPNPNKYLNSNAWINFYLIWGQIYWISRYCVFNFNFFSPLNSCHQLTLFFFSLLFSFLTYFPFAKSSNCTEFYRLIHKWIKFGRKFSTISKKRRDAFL